MFAHAVFVFLLWNAFIGIVTAYLFLVSCCNSRKKKKLKIDNGAQKEEEYEKQIGEQKSRMAEVPSDMLSVQMEITKKQTNVERKLSGQASEIPRNSKKNRSPHDITKPIQVDIHSIEKSIIEEIEERMPSGKVAGNLDDKINSQPSEELTNELSQTHHFDRCLSERHLVRAPKFTPVAKVDPENTIYLSENANKTRSASTTSSLAPAEFDKGSVTT